MNGPDGWLLWNGLLKMSTALYKHVPLAHKFIIWIFVCCFPVVVRAFLLKHFIKMDVNFRHYQMNLLALKICNVYFSMQKCIVPFVQYGAKVYLCMWYHSVRNSLRTYSRDKRLTCIDICAMLSPMLLPMIFWLEQPKYDCYYNK